MRKILHMMWMVALVALLAGCVRQEIPEVPTLQLQLRIPYAMRNNETKAPSVAALADEMKLNNLRIWVFLAEDAGDKVAGDPLGYIYVGNPSRLSTEGTQVFSISLDESVAKTKPHVHVYALANWGAIGIPESGLNAQTTLDYLDNRVLEGNHFGVENPQSSVPVGGLPFTACGRNLAISGSFPVLDVGTLTLKRAVSKVRIVMCQAADAAGPIKTFTVNSLSLSGDQIPSSSYLFNASSAPRVGDQYIPSSLPFTVPSSLALNTRVDKYVYHSGISAQEYENLVLEGIEAGELSDCGLYYLRESDVRLTGTVRYSVNGGEEVAATFSMADGEVLSRNRDWIVYLYFVGNGIRFSASWAGWTDAGSTVITPTQ